MDYSILIGVKKDRFRVLTKHTPPDIQSSEGDFVEPIICNENHAMGDMCDPFCRTEDGAFPANFIIGPGSYYIGIIDILQEWNWKKRVERLFKIYIKCLDGDGLSAVDPTRYAARFWQRCVIDTFDGLVDRLPNDVFAEDGDS